MMSLDTADYGAAMRYGFLAAEGSWVVNFDIDYFSADFLKRVIALDEVDLVIASKRDPTRRTEGRCSDGSPPGCSTCFCARSSTRG